MRAGVRSVTLNHRSGWSRRTALQFCPPTHKQATVAKSPFFARIRTQVLQLTAAVPEGKVCTCQSMGKHLDVMPRHVAYILCQLEPHEKLTYPGHRVVSANMSLAAPKRNPDGTTQAELLRNEGLLVSGNKVISSVERVVIDAANLPSGLAKQRRPDHAPAARRIARRAEAATALSCGPEHGLLPKRSRNRLRKAGSVRAETRRVRPLW